MNVNVPGILGGPGRAGTVCFGVCPCCWSSSRAAARDCSRVVTNFNPRLGSITTLRISLVTVTPNSFLEHIVLLWSNFVVHLTIGPEALNTTTPLYCVIFDQYMLSYIV